MLMFMTVLFLHRDAHTKADIAKSSSERLRWRLLAVTLYVFCIAEGSLWVYLAAKGIVDIYSHMKLPPF